MSTHRGAIGARTPGEWFAEAARCYVTLHQGCPHCRRQHCVFRSDAGPRTEYYCSACDFAACRDRATGRYYADGGGGPPAHVLAALSPGG